LDDGSASEAGSESLAMICRVFLSSTFEDLLIYRQAVEEAVPKLGMITVDVIEFHTRIADIVETSLKALQIADVMVGIYASRYGDILDDYELSLIELVYDEARRRNIPRFLYIVDAKETWPIEYLQTGVRGAMMRMMFDQLAEDRAVRRYFTTPQDLVEKVVFDLARFKVEYTPRKR